MRRGSGVGTPASPLSGTDSAGKPVILLGVLQAPGRTVSWTCGEAHRPFRAAEGLLWAPSVALKGWGRIPLSVWVGEVP